MKFQVKTKFVFEGSFFIEADSKEQAGEFVEKHCGCVLGGRGIHSSLPDELVDWDFPVHPLKIISKIITTE